MQQIHKSPYTTIYYDSVQNLFKVVRNKETETITTDEYKKEILIWSELVNTYKPKKQLIDDRLFNYIIVPELQIWINENLIVPGIKNGVRHVAFIVTTDLFSQISIEQTVEEQTEKVLNIKYFDDYKKAEEWLQIQS